MYSLPGHGIEATTIPRYETVFQLLHVAGRTPTRAMLERHPMADCGTFGTERPAAGLRLYYYGLFVAF